MINALRQRINQKHRTVGYPAAPPIVSDRFRGLPQIQPAACPDDCCSCSAVCPASAISRTPSGVYIDLGRCLFCGACARTCPAHAISFSRDHRLATRNRDELVYNGNIHPGVQALSGTMRKLFGRSLSLRQVCAGGCNGCEPDINVLSTIVYDLSRFGIKFVASPRHADGLLITGPVTIAMRAALMKTYQAVPEPKLVIATGACAISGGLYRSHTECEDGAASCIPVDLFIPGCPPHPVTILDGLLSLLGRIPPG